MWMNTPAPLTFVSSVIFFRLRYIIHAPLMSCIIAFPQNARQARAYSTTSHVASVNEYSCVINFRLFSLAFPLIVGNPACLLMFTNNPARREFRCPLYRVPLIWQLEHSYLYENESLLWLVMFTDVNEHSCAFDLCLFGRLFPSPLYHPCTINELHNSFPPECKASKSLLDY